MENTYQQKLFLIVYEIFAAADLWFCWTFAPLKWSFHGKENWKNDLEKNTPIYSQFW